MHALFSFYIAASDYVNLGGNPVRHPSSGMNFYGPKNIQDYLLFFQQEDTQCLDNDEY